MTGSAAQWEYAQRIKRKHYAFAENEILHVWEGWSQTYYSRNFLPGGLIRMNVTYLRNATAIRFATFLAPTIYPTYEYIARSIGEKVGYPTRLSVGQSFEEIVAGQVDVGFLCCLPYVQLVDAPVSSIETASGTCFAGRALSEQAGVLFRCCCAQR